MPLTLQSFARMVKSALAAKLKAERTRDRTHQQEAKNWEAHVLRAVEEIESAQQKTLFAESPHAADPQ